MKNFDKRKYDVEYMKKHKKKFQVDLNIDEFDELEKELEFLGISKTQFVRTSKEQMEQREMERDLAFQTFWNSIRKDLIEKEEQ